MLFNTKQSIFDGTVLQTVSIKIIGQTHFRFGAIERHQHVIGAIDITTAVQVADI